MRGVNKVILVGTLGRDPETKTFANGGSLTQFSIATSDSWTDKSTRVSVKSKPNGTVLFTQPSTVKLRNNTYVKVRKFILKVHCVHRQWTDQNGQERYTTEIRGEQMQMLNNNRQQGEQIQGGNDGYANHVSTITKVVVITITTTKAVMAAILQRVIATTNKVVMRTITQAVLHPRRLLSQRLRQHQQIWMMIFRSDLYNI